jgi:hypothetical protein
MLVLIATGCTSLAPAASDVPIGGPRPQFTRANLTAARQRLAGGLLEPGWLPGRFELTLADYTETDGHIRSVDLNYSDGTRYLHVWQTNLAPAELGAADPVVLGQPMTGLAWGRYSLPASQAGRPGVIDYSSRLADGRTVSIDTDLDDATMRRVLASVVIREADASP